MADTRAGDLEYITTDVLVVGCGAAGARAAIGAAAGGARTLVVTKSRLGKGGATPTANAADLTIDGLSAAEIGLPGDRRDSPKQFFTDIVADGLYLSNQKLVEAYVRENKPATSELLDWGMKVYSFETAHSQTYVRGINTSGKEIMQALGRRLNSHKPQWLVDHMVVDLLTSGNRISGAVVVDERYGTVKIVKCKAVVLATGGWQNGWLNNSASTDLTGDGQAMVYRAGGQLVDMEMFQAMPECLLWPPALRNSYITYILAEYGLGKLLNSEGERFMKRYDPRMLEQSTKEIISVATALEVRAGRGTPHGGVWYTMEGATEEEFNACLEDVSQYAPGSLQFRDEFPRVVREAFDGRTFEVGNVVHYMMGGIRVDESGRGSLSGLFAAGECSGGLWGANRVSSAISEAIVQGRIAGRSAAEYAAQAEQAEVDSEQVDAIVKRAFAPLHRKSGTAPFEVKHRVQDIAATCLGIVKNGSGLVRAVSELTDIEQNIVPDLFVSGTASTKVNAEWFEALRLTNLVQVLGLTARSALRREESRGSHYREDANVTDNDRWLVNIVTRSADGAPELTELPVVVTSLEPPSGRMTFEEANEMATASLTKAAGEPEDGNGGASQ